MNDLINSKQYYVQHYRDELTYAFAGNVNNQPENMNFMCFRRSFFHCLQIDNFLLNKPNSLVFHHNSCKVVVGHELVVLMKVMYMLDQLNVDNLVLEQLQMAKNICFYSVEID